MQTQTLIANLVDYQKQVFDNSFDMIATLQDQGVQLMDEAIEKNALLPESGRTICAYLSDFVRQNRTTCKAYVDRNFDRVKDFLADSAVPVSPVSEQKGKPPEKSKSKKETRTDTH